LGYLEVLGGFGVYTSCAKSDVISVLGDPDFLLRRRNFASISLSYRDPHFGLFGGFGGFWGYLPTSGAKSDVIFLLGDPDFLLRRRYFAPISLSYRDPHFGGFGGLWGDPFPELTQNVIRSSHGHSTPSLKISCKSVQPFSCNLADKETNKERKKERKKEIERKQYPAPGTYRGRGNHHRLLRHTGSTQQQLYTIQTYSEIIKHKKDKND